MFRARQRSPPLPRPVVPRVVIFDDSGRQWRLVRGGLAGQLLLLMPLCGFGLPLDLRLEIQNKPMNLLFGNILKFYCYYLLLL